MKSRIDESAGPDLTRPRRRRGVLWILLWSALAYGLLWYFASSRYHLRDAMIALGLVSNVIVVIVHFASSSWSEEPLGQKLDLMPYYGPLTWAPGHKMPLAARIANTASGIVNICMLLGLAILVVFRFMISGF